jgi:hypothetical protein
MHGTMNIKTSLCSFLVNILFSKIYVLLQVRRETQSHFRSKEEGNCVAEYSGFLKKSEFFTQLTHYKQQDVLLFYGTC